MNTAEFLMIASSVVPDRIAMACDGQDPQLRRDAGPRQPPRQRPPGDGRRQGRQGRRHGAQLDGVRRGLLRRREARRRLRPPELPREEGRARLHVQQLGDEGAVRRRALPRARRQDQARTRHGGAHRSASTDTPRVFRTTKTSCRSTSPEEIFTDVDDNDPTIVIYTSGTTALPKGVVLTYLGMSVYVTNTVAPADPGAERSRTSCSSPCPSTTSPAPRRCSRPSGAAARW